MKPSCQLITTTSLHTTLVLLYESYAADVGALWDAYEDGWHLGEKPKMECGYGVLEEAITAISFGLACKANLGWELNSYGGYDLTISKGTAKEYRAYFDELARRIQASPYAPWVVLPKWENQA